MKVEIRRHGIVIKSVNVSGERARIGSSDDCEIQLNDRFLSPVVAELVRNGDSWKIVDSGTSLEGVQTETGSRVLEELISPGTTYVVGAFEVQVGEDRGGRSTPATRSGTSAGDAIPMTVFADLSVPMTVVGPIADAKKPPSGGRTTAPAPQKLAFTPVDSSAPIPPTTRLSPVKPPSALRRVLILALVVISTVMLGLIVVMKTTSRPKRAATSATTTAPAQSAAPATEQVPPVRGDELAARLDLRKAFDAWEVEVQKSADPAIRRRIANGAFELGRAYLAAGDDANAAFYLEKVVRYGEPESEPVRVAQRRLQYLKRPGSL